MSENIVAEKAAAAKTLLQKVSSGIMNVLHPERYAQFLNIVARFHWYSYINNLLILYQYPQAKYLAGFDVWKRTSLATYNDPTRRILKSAGGGQGIKLIAPFTVVKSDSRSLISVVVPVYDINQINELPRPENDFLDLAKCSYVDIINAINFVAPYRTAFASNEDPNLSYNVKGYCNHANQQFVVDSRLSVRGMLSVLLHEFVVAELYLQDYKNENLQGLIVESAFYILLRHFRLEVDNVTFSYIGRYRNVAANKISDAFYLIQTIAHSIIEKIEEHLEYIIELIPVQEEYSYQASLFDELDFGQGSMNE